MAEAQLVRAIGELETGKQMSARELAQAVKAFLTRKRLLRRTGKIMRALDRYEAAQAGIVLVTVTSAHSLGESTKEVIKKKAEALLAPGRDKVKLDFEEDPKLLGGVRLETTDTRYDFSLKRALNQLGKSLAN